MGAESLTPAPNLYAHFPFCRRKCAYCALHSRPGAKQTERDAYAAALAGTVEKLRIPQKSLSTIYFGGGSPALCDLRPMFKALAPFMSDNAEFTVELHPLDISGETMRILADGGVNRISMGVQSMDDTVLRSMGRGYTIDAAAVSFAKAKETIPNAGIDLIAGYPGDTQPSVPSEWGFVHCSVYSLILEEGTALAANAAAGRTRLPGDDDTLDAVASMAESLESIGLARYEISNWAKPGFECRHNLAVWRGEDYIGIGEGARGRIGRLRTVNFGAPPSRGGKTAAREETERTGEKEDAIERRIFSLRTRDGLDAEGFPEWEKTLDKFTAEGLLERAGGKWRLTKRGAEVCDSILAELV